MADDSQTRKLATIVALDVAGYSARTEADEARTTAEVAALRTVIEAIAAKHGGRVFNTAGDGFMLEFGSSLAAVEAAFELAETCEPKVRVGVHLGDVVVQANGDLLGHGVNVAARLMAQSAPGAALVSATVRQTIRGPIAERLVSRGTIKLDKMAETIEAFALVAAASVQAAAQAKGADPLLAVLPFDNLSNDPELQFFSDGIAEEILQAIARGSTLNVIGRTSAFQFRGDRKGGAAQALGATHVLDGAVRRSGVRMRVTVQLTEGRTNRLLWTDRYDRNVSDAFELQDDIAGHVTVALKQTLTRPATSPAKIDPIAYDLYLQARALLPEGRNADLEKIEALLTQAVSRAPEAADIWALLASVRSHLLPADHDSDGEPIHEAARMAARHALALDPRSGEALVAQALLKPAFAEHGEKLRFAETAYTNAPSDPLVTDNYAWFLQSVGRTSAALALTEQAMRLEPLSTMKAVQYAHVLSNVGRVEEAVTTIEGAWSRLPHTPWLLIGRLNLYLSSGLLDEAERIANSSDYAALPGAAMEPVNGARVFISVLRLPLAQREQLLPLDPALKDHTKPLVPYVCAALAFAGLADFAFDLIFDALDTGRAIGNQSGAVGGRVSRATTTTSLFDTRFAIPLQQNIRFPRLCARLGLVDYWSASGHWPDCAQSVAPYYDFKTECLKAGRETAKL